MMGALAALRLLGWLRGAVAGLGGFVTRYPMVALCALLLALCGGLYQRGNRYAAAAAKAQSTLTRERADAEAAKAQAEADYRSKAHAADVSFQAGLADGSNRLAAYVASHRVQPAAAPHSPGPAQGGDPGIPAIPPAETVLAELSDLRTCNADYAYAKAAHDWAMGLR